MIMTCYLKMNVYICVAYSEALLCCYGRSPILLLKKKKKSSVCISELYLPHRQIRSPKEKKVLLFDLSAGKKKKPLQQQNSCWYF